MMLRQANSEPAALKRCVGSELTLASTLPPASCGTCSTLHTCGAHHLFTAERDVPGREVAENRKERVVPIDCFVAPRFSLFLLTSPI